MGLQQINEGSSSPKPHQSLMNRPLYTYQDERPLGSNDNLSTLMNEQSRTEADTQNAQAN